MEILDNKEYSEIMNKLKNSNNYSYLVVMTYPKGGSENELMTRTITSDSSILDYQAEFNMFSNIALQYQFKYHKKLSEILGKIATADMRNHEKGFISSISSNPIVKELEKLDKEGKNFFGNYDELLDKFGHSNNVFDHPGSIQKYKEEYQYIEERLQTLSKNGLILPNYLVFINYDNSVMSLDAPKEFDEAIQILGELYTRITVYHHVEPGVYIQLLLEKASKLRTQLIHATVDQTQERKNSLVLKLAKRGYIDFDRSLPESHFEQDFVKYSKIMHDQKQDQDIVFVETDTTNLLSLTYSDFNQLKTYLLLLSQAIYQEYPQDYKNAVKKIREFFKKTDIDTIFYPSKVWRKYKDAMSYRGNNSSDTDEMSLPIQDIVTMPNIENGKLLALIAAVFDQGSAKFSIMKNSIYESDITDALIQLLGTLMSIYPDKKAELADWSGSLYRYLDGDYIDL